MKKAIVAIVCLLVIIGAIFTGIMIYKKDHTVKVEERAENKAQVSEKVEDECTEEEQYYENQNLIDLLEASSKEEKISPNCSMTLKRTYSTCGHTNKEYIDISESLINKKEEDLKVVFPDWKIEKYSNNEIILSKNLEGECGEHFLVKEKDGKVVINHIDESGEELEYQTTQISTEYLTETDQITIQNGIRINGKEKLNEFIENFE